jgi:hypothetical protein
LVFLLQQRQCTASQKVEEFQKMYLLAASITDTVGKTCRPPLPVMIRRHPEISPRTPSTDPSDRLILENSGKL